ncbi:outer membrane protein assembly factor [Photobacterium ganghwense]|uniref:Translocation and assembly module subunit TamA n=2 Tax=Photobacterium ganghwense TaxID=320778 RepID=A0A0J1HHR2_9GAMM|nr:membrane protein [Photobacterium ganghwense]PSU05215.1 outer membrane protein assembly factor [Photobacterium ganghwense]QSV13838.1 outer membrane protein assembly factor [Photobacterium ganghwense]
MKTHVMRYSLAAFALSVTLPVSAATSLEITGVKGKLKDNVDAYVSAIPEKDYSTSLRFRQQLEGEIRDALKALGRYNPTISFTDSVDGDNSVLKVAIKPGPKTVIAKSDIQITGDAQDDPDVIELVRNSGLGLGKTLNHGKYESLKSSLSSLALRKGYFDAELLTSRMEVAPSRNEAYITIEFASGARYHFGKTTFKGSQIDLDRLESLIPYEEGDPYLASSLGEFNQRLSNVGWFSSIFVGGAVAQRHDEEIPVNVVLSPQVRNQVETGIGYSTDVGVRLKMNWHKPWLNSAGHSLDVKTELSTVQPKIEAVYKIPLDDVLNDYYQVVGGIRYVDNHDTVSTEYSLGLERHWRLDSNWKRVASLRVLYEDYNQGAEESGVLAMVLPGLSYDRTRVRGGAMPTWGDKQMISMEYSDPALGSDTRLFHLRGRSAWIRSWAEDHRGLVRIDGGAVFADRLEDVPPSMRFFVGGDNSLRGYSYESIAPRDSEGRLRGGKYMLTSTAEYQYRVYGNWWGAVFYDYGSAWNDSPDWLAGAGVGVRWASPVGPVRVDFAWGLDKDKDKFQLHFVLGPEI